ncbi:MAG: EAL domain-containing protein, partial [Pseudomonadota bacterium]
MVFSHLDVGDGLSQNSVLDVHQDSRGFIWIATESGLNRFDGYTFTQYNQNRAAATALSSDYIWDIDEDARGDLWLATKGGGLARYVRAEDRFVSYRHDPDNPASLSSDAARAVWVDNAQRAVWVGTRGGGLNRLDIEQGTVTHFRHDADDPASLGDDTINDIQPDALGRLWVATHDGISVLDPDTGLFYHHKPDADDDRSLADGVVKRLFVDRAGVMWAGTFKGGLQRHDSVTDRFVRYRHDANDPSSLSDDYVSSILEDDEGRLWVGTQDGLNLFNRQTQTFTRYARSASDPTSLGNNGVSSLHQDASGLLWIGTLGGGVSLWDPRSWRLGHYTNDLLSGAMTVALATDREQRVWIGALGAPLGRLDRASGNFETLTDILGRADALTDPRAMALLLDHERNTLWVGTMSGGLHRIDLARRQVDVFRHDPDDPTSLAADGIMSLAMDGSGQLWVGTFGGGVCRFDADSRSFERFASVRDDATTLSSPRATALAFDPSGRLWVGTDDAGLNLVDPATGRVHRFTHDPGRLDSLSSDGVYDLHVDAQGTLWIGTTDSGLDRVRRPTEAPSNVVFENLNHTDGLASNTVYGIESDPAGHLWLSGNNGLSRFDPETGAFRTYHRRSGLQGQEFNFGAHHRDAFGWLYFGGANGINAFDPAALEQSRPAPRVALTGIELFNKPAELDRPVAQIDSLALTYRDDVLTLEFAALDYVDPDRNRYRYRLDGFDRDWVDIGNRRRVTYTNLDAGDYLFRVVAANSDGTWNEKGLAIPVAVAPAPWETPLAYVAYVVAALSIIGGVFLWQHRRLKAAAQLRQLAYYDALSGLPNIKLFRQRLGEAIRDARTQGDSVALLYLDLDRFKRINDTLGHTVGDWLLKSVAARLSQCVYRRGDGVGQIELARLSGDQFLIFLRHRYARREARALARDIAEELAAPFTSGGQELILTASVGAAVFPDHGEDGEALLKAADVAVAQAKAEGRRTFRIYSRRMNSRAMQRLSMENEIRLALEGDQFQLYFQPKYRAGDLKIIGAEALLRWFHPTRGEISPSNFISVAEEAGLISNLSRWVVRRACGQMATWRDEGLPLVPIAVNLSPEDFLRDDPVAMVREALEEAHIDTEYLQLEITESALMRDTTRVSHLLDELKGLGCTLSIDDFGTGYSSLAYLRRFPLDALKIDRSFVSDIDSDDDAGAICAAVIAMGRALGLIVVAEGVESD